MRVAVPFGKSKIYTALALKVHKTAPTAYEPKTIHQILDQHSVITRHQLEHWQWIADYYMCSLGEVMRAAMPSAFILESETVITKTQTENYDENGFSDDEFLIFEALQHQSELRINDVISILEKKRVLPTVNSLVDKGILQLKEELYEKYQPKMLRFVKLSPAYSSPTDLEELLISMKRAPKQHEVLLTYFSMQSTSSKPISVRDLVKKSKASSQIVKALIDKSIFEEYTQQVNRIQTIDSDNDSLTLSASQNEALIAIKNYFETKSTVLLHGVTSSGKTEIYVKLIESQLDRNKQVLYLLPEIALTTQLVQRLRHYFGKKVSVFHSRYTNNERVEVWNQLLDAEQSPQVIIGPRSALLLPFSNLGLIIVDEEHEVSYKQFDPAPRYHARDAAIVLANIHHAKVLLGSATPSIESYHNARVGKYGLVELKTRYNNVLLPDIELVDLADKYRRKRMKGHFSDRLIEEISEALNEDHQVILFQNRRGFSPIVECTTCGHSPQCPNCDVSLTYHQYRDQLRCHYCGYNTVMIKQCQACGSTTLNTKGFGTQQIEEEANQLFPEANVARMDLDTTRGKYAFDKIINKFENRDVDILVGTQMLTKGLDFRYVRLVGIMNADNLLNFPDFRAHERSYQLMAQVAGRAGRTDIRGKVLIQSYNPNHRILQQVSTNAYEDMFEEQLNERHNYRYPPIFRLIKITLKHKDYNRVNKASDWYGTSLRQIFGSYVLGPEFPPISRIRNQFIKNILLKIPPKQSLQKTKSALSKIDTSFNSIKDFRAVRVNINVDNY